MINLISPYLLVYTIISQYFELEKALKEFSRVSKKNYLMVESYQNNKQLFNLQCWALTCESFFSPKEWEWIFKKFKIQR